MKFDDQYLKETLLTANGDKDNFHIPKGITRYDFGNTHGWWVRVEREQAKFHQLFSDGKYGGIEDAFIESINFRHEVISSFPLEMRKRTVKKNGLAKNPDDRIARCIAKGKNQPYIHWKAVWYDEDYKLKKREFSVLKFGEDGAKELALEQATQNHNYNPKEETLVKPFDPYEQQKFRIISREDVEILSSINSK